MSFVPISIEQYIAGDFPDFDNPSMTFHLSSASQRHHGARVTRIFTSWFRRFGDVAVTVLHMVGFMLYRVAGEGNDEDPFSGAISLDAFYSDDLFPLLHRLKFNREIEFGWAEIQSDARYQEIVGGLRRFVDQRIHASSRIIWFQDEVRLRACFNLDTMSKRDEAIFVLMMASGFRAESVSQIELGTDVEIEADGTVVITLPMVKTHWERDFYFPVTGEYALVLRRWIGHRKCIFPDSRFLFVNRFGQPIDSNDVTQMLWKLSRLAGYGEAFFTSHSFRRSYANRKAARVFCEGGALVDATRSIADGCRWSIRSKIAERYLDKNLPNYFHGGRNLSWTEFTQLSPHQMHGLREMVAGGMRPIGWFVQPSHWLQSVCTELGVRQQSSDYDTRVAIADKLRRTHEAFRLFAYQASRASNKRDSILMADIIGCLLEDGCLDLENWLAPSNRDLLLRAVTPMRVTGRKETTARHALQPRVHRLHTRDHARRVASNAKKSIYDRQLHLGRLPSGEVVTLRVPSREILCIEARYRPFDLERDFPYDPVPPPPILQAISPSPPRPPPALPSPAAPSTPAVPKSTPTPKASAVNCPIPKMTTPSTTATTAQPKSSSSSAPPPPSRPNFSTPRRLFR